ncbi:hypothetical protein NARC_10261 [Candidatus Nitrosocosmicus arcticus]|uniref:Uncharacterized protein n=1 Tax=Candidatus Nitrosocosmicus arcticus TaxID=2035267 RepID=A0A557SZ40_9ARCH|nr:hypothetical protein NARC_10261 [Candidatus Nitrosocosmicus arcticus]
MNFVILCNAPVTQIIIDKICKTADLLGDRIQSKIYPLSDCEQE